MDIDSRARNLLCALAGLEAIVGNLPEAQTDAMLHDISVACGFADEGEAWTALVKLRDTMIRAQCEQLDALVMTHNEHIREEHDGFNH